jgi:hypothetical protein
MIPEGSDEKPAPAQQMQPYVLPQRKEPSFGRYIFYITWGITFVFLLASIVLTLNPMWASELASNVNPFFFILLLPVILPVAQVLPILIVMFAFYLIFFVTMIYRSTTSREKYALDTPVGYYAATSSAFLLLVTIITLIEGAFNTPVGGGGLEQGFQTQPFQTYFSVIYAPFAEEIGFRIIPLGLFSFFLVLNRSRNLRDSLVSIVLPGIMRKKYKMRFTKVEWALVLITSAIFGYAHIFFGAWDWGKFLPTFVTGIILAVGFLKFGIYVDIPMHWFFNGFLTLYVLQQSLLFASGLALMWIYFAGVVGLVFIALYIRGYLISRNTSAPVP